MRRTLAPHRVKEVRPMASFRHLTRFSPNDPLPAVPPAVAVSPTVYSTDPAHLEHHRLKLARAVEKAMQKR